MSYENNIPKLVVLTGPTAVGKTALSIKIAKAIDAEIISADSMQVYRGMDIGTAKITPGEMEGVPHHMIDIIEPDEEFSVMIFKERAKKLISEITERGHIPMIVGGTGYYIQAVLYDVDFTEYSDDVMNDVRSRLFAELERSGSLYMHEKLRKIDPESAAIIHPNNTKRLIHALEYYEITGIPISRHNAEQHERTSPYDFVYIVINDERDKVYRRIDERVDKMFEDGLLDEVKRLRAKGYTQKLCSMMGLGYKETDDHLSGLITLEEASELIKRDTRHFAKKQLTWFKREKDAVFFNRYDHSSEQDIEDAVLQYICEGLGLT